MATIDKLNYVSETKDRLKTVANYAEAGISADIFRSYPEKIYNSYIDIINEDIDIKADLPKLNSEGTSIDIEDALDEPLIDFSLYGDTQQDSTTGKNLLNNKLTSNTYNGITYVVNEDKSVTLKSGTATAITWLILNSSITLQAGTYTLSSGNTSNTIRMYCGALGGYTSDGIRTKTLTSSQTSDVSINIPNGTSITTPITIYPMIQTGSSATSYEPYTNGASPNPNYPQPIHNVSGDNTIEICGKNICESIYNNGETRRYFRCVYAKAPLKENTKYTISFNVDLTGTLFYSNENIFTTSGSISVSSGTRNNITLTTKSDLSGLSSSDYNSNGYALFKNYVALDSEATFSNMQIEEGETASEYQAYTGNSQLISLGVENMLNNSTMTAKSSCTITNEEITSSALGQYTLFEINTNNIKLEKNIDYYVTFKAKLDSGTGTLNYGGVLYDGTNNTSQSSVTKPTISSSYQLFCWKISTTLDNFVGKIMRFQLGAGASNAVISIKEIVVSKIANATYKPYGDYIELNKISTYQDYIYKDNDRWFLHKEIGKVVLDGTTNKSFTGTWGTTNNGYAVYTTISSLKDKSLLSYSNNFIYEYTPYSNMGLYKMGSSSGSSATFTFVLDNSITSLTNANNWLSTHNTIVYYVLATPTDTEITDTTLLEQLNNLMTLPLYKNLTHITLTPNDLQPTMKIATIKSYNTLWQEEE